MSAAQLSNLRKTWKLSDNVKVTASVGKSSKYFKDGVSLSLRIDAEYYSDLGEDGQMKIDLTATFVKEIAISTDISANAEIKWIIIVPKIKSLKFGASVDIKNYSAISIDVKIYTVEKEKADLWKKLKSYNEKLGAYLEKADELKEKIDTGEESEDYEEELEGVWQTIRDKSKTMPEGELTKGSYYSMLDALGLINVTEEMRELLNLTNDAEIEAGVKDLMERYSQMLKTESDWITLVQKEIFSKDMHISIFAISIDMDFVVKANVNIALGANMKYVVGKRYSFWIDVIKKTSGSSAMDLMDEKFAFQFYVMGALGIKIGVETDIKAGLGSTKLGSIGVTAEFGPYLKLWGYFIYEYTKMKPANTNT